MACLRLLTFLPELPDFKVPRFILCISRLTALPAFFEYFRPVDLRPVDFLGGMETLLKVVSWWAEGKKKSGKTSVANGGRTSRRPTLPDRGKETLLVVLSAAVPIKLAGTAGTWRIRVRFIRHDGATSKRNCDVQRGEQPLCHDPFIGISCILRWFLILPYGRN